MSDTFDDEVELLEVIDEEVTAEIEPLPIDSIGCISTKWIEQKNQLEIPLVVLDSQLIIRWRNDAFRAFRETEGLEYHGRPFHALFTSFADPGFREKLISTLKNPKTGYGWKNRVIGRGQENRRFIADINIIPLEYSGKKPEWYLAVINDVTEHQKSIIKANFDSILKASLLKDEDTGDHIKRVNAYSLSIASKLKGQYQWTYFVDNPDDTMLVDNDFIENIGILAAFHDVGKIGTPESILLKNGKLNDDEWAVMKEHPANGALILDSHPVPMAKRIAKSHHERWNGTGYPFSLEGDDPKWGIPLSARIVAIADVYDALRTRRPYKEPFSEEKTCSIITSEAGTHFDPGLIEVFNGIKDEFNRIFHRLSDE
ncbi:MAG: HD domain-containing protein [Spirochaetaceae bacterium]|nr:HD domain-containing protein [Spirochaetaceae bacterium]